MLATGLIFAEERAESSSRTTTTAKDDFNFGYAEHVIDERTIDRLELFDRSDSDQSSRYNVELNLENEDSDWSFEVTVTVDF